MDIVVKIKRENEYEIIFKVICSMRIIVIVVNFFVIIIILLFCNIFIISL